MSTILTVVLIAAGAVGFFVLAMSLTLIFKGHHIDSEISTNKDMQRLGIKCAVQETREDMAAEIATTTHAAETAQGVILNIQTKTNR